MNVIHDIMTTIEVVLSVALGISETLALIPKVKSNSISQLVYNLLKKLRK